MAKPADEYYELGRLTDWLLHILVGGMVLTGVMAVSTLFELRLFDVIESGNFESEEALMKTAESNDQRQRALGFLAVGWGILTIVLSLVWIYRSAHNARVRAGHMDHTPAGSIGWYFVPIVNLWKPYYALKEVFSESARQAGSDEARHRQLLVTWWVAWLVLTFARNAEFKLSLRADDLYTLRFADQVSLVAAVVDLLATFVFITVIRRLSTLQDQARERSDVLAKAPVEVTQA